MVKTAAPARPPSTPRDPARRRRVLEAAKRHFTQYGIKGTRLDAVAAEAGCAKGALYLEFADKESLLRAVVDEVFDHVRTRYAVEVAGLESPLERLVATVRFAFQQHAAEPIFSRLMRDDPDLAVLRPAAAAEAQMAAARAQVDMLTGWVDEGIGRGEIRGDVDREAVAMVIGLLRMLPQHTGTLAGFMTGERALAAVVDIFAAGLAARAAPATRTRRAASVRRSKSSTQRRRA